MKTILAICLAMPLTGVTHLGFGSAVAGDAEDIDMKSPRLAKADRSRVQPRRSPDKVIAFKKTPQGDLQLHCYLPPQWKAGDRRPAIIFWFGGGFVGGTPTQFFAKAEYFAGRGLVAISAEYRIKNTHGTELDKCFEDGRSAMRWIKNHAAELGLDPERIIGAGGSAGGSIAQSMVFGSGPDASGEDPAVGTAPAALVLFNPAAGNKGPRKTSYSREELQRLVDLFSPLRNIKKSGVPAIAFFGSKDDFLAEGREFANKSTALGNRYELWIADGVDHGFFNAAPWHQATLRKADEFLVALGYLEGAPTVAVPAGAELRRLSP